MQKGWSKLCFKFVFLPFLFSLVYVFEKNQSKKNVDNLRYLFCAFLGIFLGAILGSVWLKRGQDVPKRVIRSFKDPKRFISKTLKNSQFFNVFVSRVIPRVFQIPEKDPERNPKR